MTGVDDGAASLLDEVIARLEEGRRIGLLGPAPVARHVAHAAGFVEALTAAGGLGSGPVLDLGSGGGLPGLVCAAMLVDTCWTLLDARARSAEFLRHAATAVGIADRVAVVEGRAEDIARHEGRRSRYAGVVSRGFGSPPVTAECGAGFVRVGGVMVVSEPPATRVEERWPSTGLALLGMEVDRAFLSATGDHFVVLRQAEPCPAAFPRKAGVPKRRPLF